MEHLLLGKLALIGAVGIGAQWLAWRLHAPAVILLTAGGLLLGPVFGLIQPHADFGHLLRPFVGLAVAVILFEGGLSLEREELRRVGATVQRLLLVAVPVTWGLTAAAAHLLAGFSWPVAFLVGALLVITGPTVIIPLLRQAKLDRETAWSLKWEGILNDPVGALLAVVVFEYLTLAQAAAPPVFFLTAVAGILGAGLLGFAAAAGFAWATRRGEIAEFLKAPVLIALVAAVYALGNMLQAEAGLIGVTVLGAGLANLGLASLDQLRRFKEYVGVVLVSGLFVVLAATLEPGMAGELDWGLAAFVAALLLAIRPAAVWLATLGTGLDWRRRLFLGWIAPRGIVAVAIAGVFGPRLAEAGYAEGATLVPLAFLVVIVTVVLHGGTVGWLGRRLGLAAGPEHDVLIVGATPWSCALARTLGRIGLPVVLADPNPHHLAPAREADTEVFEGEILSEQAEQRLDLDRFEHVIAATDSDSYNALVASQFALEQGTDRTFQLASHPEAAPEVLRREARGRVLLGEGYDSDWLDDRLRDGWGFGCLRIGKKRAELPEEAIAVAVLSAAGEVRFRAAEGSFRPGEGDTLVLFAPPDALAKLDDGGRQHKRRAKSRRRSDKT